jgi:hypothetical protein
MPTTEEEVLNPTGPMPNTRIVDWRTEVQRYEDLNAPEVEYVFSNGRQFKRLPGQTGLYNE